MIILDKCSMSKSMLRIFFLCSISSLIIAQIQENTVQHSTPKMIRCLYSTYVGRAMRSFFTAAWVSNIAGWYANSRISRLHIPSFIKKHHIDLSEVMPANYKTFNEFFIRRLKPEARQINHKKDVLVSPADGAVSVFNDISADTFFIVKNCTLDLAEFLQSEQEAREYEHGALIIVRLAPWDYHRFHFPYAGKASCPRIITGPFESVNPFVYKKGIQPLLNERHVISLETDAFGVIKIIAVGAMCVGRIQETYQAQQLYQKGDEMGYFEFGGSTIVLLFKPGTFVIDEKFSESHLDKEVPIKMGQALGYAHQKNS